MKKKYIAFVTGLLLIAIIVVFGNLFLIKSVDVVFINKPEFADEDNIINASEISINTNIFNINDENIKDNINSYYDNNSLAVLDIERVFPNKVVIHVKERKPVLIVPYAEEDGDECVPTDINFQMVKKQNKSDIDYDSIQIKGLAVQNTFNNFSFRQINSIMTAFTDMNFTDDMLVAFIKEIVVNDDYIRIVLRHGDSVFDIELVQDKDIYDSAVEAYHSFLDLDYDSRNVCHITV
ncbi:MAG: cell division protein FtsQ/DivIB [Bacillota bacterium]